jgi:DNA-directed RNA polymerase subunit RPC12/RpoP
MSDPAQQAPNTAAKQFPCSSCGAKLEFAPGTAALKCPYCSHSNKIPQSADEILELDFYEYFARATEQGESIEAQTVKCQSCGATSTLQPNISMSHCPFCGTQLQAKAKASRLIKPGAIIPFRIPRNRALELFREWLGSLWFAPGGLKDQAAKNGGIKGMYIPYWTFDAKSTTWYDGERGEDYYETEYYDAEDSNGNTVTRSRTVTHTRWYNVNGTVWQNFDDILVQAGRSLPQNIVDELEPWGIKQLVPYQDAYMSGFQAEVYQVDLGDGFERAKAEMDSNIRETVKRDIGGNHQRINTVRTQFDGITFKHILLPVWISAYKYGGKSYRFLINGETGEVQGERPWSVAKIALTVIGVVIILLLIALVLQS